MNWGAIHYWFAREWGLLLLAVLPVLGLIGVLARRQKRRALARLGSVPALETLVVGRRTGPSLLRVCWPAGLFLLILGIAGPQWGEEHTQATAPGRDLVMVLDLSRSMLAQDVLGQSAPNRLGRAKDALLDLLHTVERRGGHRLALVVFAARAQVVCPLTHDYDHVRDTLRNLDADDPLLEIGPLPSGAVSGTRVGAALRQAVAIHDPRFRGHQDVLLLSDGDDPAGDDEWRAGIDAAREQGIPVHTVGIGDPDKDSPIPNGAGGYLRHLGQVVLTRLQEKPLAEIARLTKGVYTPARTQALPLGELFRERIESRGGYEDTDDPLPIYRQRAPWFFAGALFFLALEMVVGQRRRKQIAAPGPSSDSQGLMIFNGKQPPLSRGPVLLAVLALALLSAAPVRDAGELMSQGNAAFDRGDFDMALDLYTQAAATTTDPGLVAFNQAAALYRLGRYREAELHYLRCKEDASDERLARLLYDLGNCLVMEGQDRDAKLLERAIGSYEECLRQPDAGLDLLEDARANLDLTKILLTRAKARKDDRGSENPNPDDGDPRPDNPREGPGPTGTEPRPGSPGQRGQPGVDGGADQPGNKEGTSQPSSPGKGNEPPIRDQNDLVPMSPEDTAAYVRDVAARVLHERREHKRHTASPPSSTVKNW